MTSDETPRDRDLDLHRDILSGRRYSLAEAIGREGGSFLKGDSPVPKLVQAIAEIDFYIETELDDSGALQEALQVWARNDTARVSRHLNEPLLALREIVEEIVANSYMLYEFVRQVDVKWGELNNERPHFQRPGQPPHPDDEYTHESVRSTLLQFLETLPS